MLDVYRVKVMPSFAVSGVGSSHLLDDLSEVAPTLWLLPSGAAANDSLGA